MGIGSRYEESRARLRDKIREGVIEFHEFNVGEHRFTCYFCSGTATGTIYGLVEREDKSAYFHYVHESCFEKAKVYLYEGNEPILCIN